MGKKKGASHMVAGWMVMGFNVGDEKGKLLCFGGAHG